MALSGEVYSRCRLRQKINFLPDLTKIPEAIARKSKLLFLNYPNNPTAAVIPDKAIFKDWIQFAKKYDIIVCHDNAYSEVTFDGYVAPSFLEVEGAKDVGVEVHSFSKSYNMAGWRIGWMCGNPRVIAAMEKFQVLPRLWRADIHPAVRRRGAGFLAGHGAACVVGLSEAP